MQKTEMQKRSKMHVQLKNSSNFEIHAKKGKNEKKKAHFLGCHKKEIVLMILRSF